MTFDLLIEGADLLDGTGAESVRADLGITGGRIAEIGSLGTSRARERIDGSDRVVSPGFIDIHSHDDFNLPLNPRANGKTLQGVTTVVTGNCGFSPAPLLPDTRGLLQEVSSFLDSGLDYDWQTFGQFLDALPATSVNIAPLVGHVAVRCAAMGVEERASKPKEMETMKALVAEAMEAGAHGFSTGLIYPPSCYADRREITQLAAVAAKFGGGYFTHMRDEGAGVLDSIKETIAVGKGSGAYMQIAHFKVTNAANWGKSGEMLAMIDKARADGLHLTCDQYPYTATSTGMKTMLPQWTQAGGSEALVARLEEESQRGKIRREVLAMFEKSSGRVGTWEDAIVSDSPSHPQYAGMNLEAIAATEKKPPVDALLDLLIADKAKTLGVFFCMDEADIFNIMRHPAVAIGSDGIFLGVPGQPDHTRPHPRYFGTFPRVVGRYTRENPVLELPEAVRKMTSLPADILRLPDRGRIAPGYAADLVLFDSAMIIDTATYQDPRRTPIGIDTVLVNGVPVVRGGTSTDATPGTVLRRGA